MKEPDIPPKLENLLKMRVFTPADIMNYNNNFVSDAQDQDLIPRHSDQLQPYFPTNHSIISEPTKAKPIYDRRYQILGDNNADLLLDDEVAKPMFRRASSSHVFLNLTVPSDVWGPVSGKYYDRESGDESPYLPSRRVKSMDSKGGVVDMLKWSLMSNNEVEKDNPEDADQEVKMIPDFT